MKKLCVILALVLSMANISVFAEGEPTINVSSTEVKTGEIAEIDISLENNPGIISMHLQVNYDAEALELKNVTDEGLLGTSVFSDRISANPFILFWTNGTATEDIKANGTIATLRFEVLKDAKAGVYPIEIYYDNADDAIFNYDFETVDFKVVDGQISVLERAEGEVINEDTIPDEPITEITVVIDGTKLEFPDQKPVIMSDRTLVPLRAIFEALGAEVDWDDETKTVLSKRDDTTISLTIGSDALFVNNVTKLIDVPAQIINDRTMVPIRAIAESFGCDVGWDGRTKTVIITN